MTDRFAAAEAIREQWARDHGVANFTEAMRIGLRLVGHGVQPKAAPVTPAPEIKLPPPQSQDIDGEIAP